MRPRQNPFQYGRFLALSLMGLLVATPTLGAIPGEEQNCINELNKGLASVAKAQGKVIGSCIKDGSKGKLGDQTIEECMTADSKKVSKAKAKARTKAASKCPSPPSFGPTDPNTVNAVAVAKELILVHQIFGTDLDAAILDQDEEGGKCQVNVAKATKKCQDTRLKQYNKCKRDGLKSGSILGASGLEACLGADPKLKIAKACGKKLKAKIDKQCVGKLGVFPGCNDPSPTSGTSRTRARPWPILHPGNGARTRPARLPGRARRRRDRHGHPLPRSWAGLRLGHRGYQEPSQRHPER